MNIAPDCYVCIYNQTLNLTKRLNLEANKSSEILKDVARILSKYDLNITPPEIAAEVYNLISKKTGINDPFLEAKNRAINEAKKFKKLLKIDNLYDALKIAAAGNVIDLGVNSEFDLEKEINDIFNIAFKYNDFDEFKEKLKTSKNIVYLADNAGENIFDEILIKKLKEYVGEIYYFVRGKPVINDITKDDLNGLEINDLATIVDTGVITPGFSLKYANEKSKEIFFNADLVISKGMGNFECLFDECKREVFYLFKVKCNVVANASKTKVGDYVFIKNNK